jgi:UDP-N-acetylglucosamine 2-epimerase (non-hydrolysing)
MIIYLIGTKAQYIKMAPVILQTKHRGLSYQVVFSGQHRETFDELRKNFDLPEASVTLTDSGEAKDRASLAIWAWESWRRACSHELRGVWRNAKTIVVHGDTASTLLGALIGKRFSVPVTHVEAGLRSFNVLHPFPEELIRIGVSKLTNLHLCPDEIAIKNLSGVKGEKVLTEGNTLLDSLRIASSGAEWASRAEGPPFAVFSMHRHENIFNNRRLHRALSVLEEVAGSVPVKFVLHPVTKKRLSSLGLMERIRNLSGVTLVDRTDFVSFIRLITGARLVLSDGGSNQEECAALGIPCVLLRRSTERHDGLGTTTLLADLDRQKISAFVRTTLVEENEISDLPTHSPSELVVDAIQKKFM